jgi:hypothetical protein
MRSGFDMALPTPAGATRRPNGREHLLQLRIRSSTFQQLFPSLSSKIRDRGTEMPTAAPDVLERLD